MDMCDGLWFPAEPGVGALSTSGGGGGGGYAAVSSPSSASACLSSPSSGYSSSDEGRVTPTGETGWASPAELILSSDPYLGELVMTPTSWASSRRSTDAPAVMASTWSASSLVLDDFVDTLWDSLAAGAVDASPRPSLNGIRVTHCITDCNVSLLPLFYTNSIALVLHFSFINFVSYYLFFLLSIYLLMYRAPFSWHLMAYNALMCR